MSASFWARSPFVGFRHDEVLVELLLARTPAESQRFDKAVGLPTSELSLSRSVVLLLLLGNLVLLLAP